MQAGKAKAPVTMGHSRPSFIGEISNLQGSALNILPPETDMSQTRRQQHPCGNCAFYRGSVWQPISISSVSVLTRGFARKNLVQGQALFHQEDVNQGVFCVSSGLVALRAHHEDGRSTLLRLAYPGDVIGYRSFLENRAHRTEARALMPSRVCTVVGRDARQLIGANPAVMSRLTSHCISEIDRNHDRIIATATISNQQRLSDFLSRLLEAHGQTDKGHLRMKLPLSRRDLADLLGVQPETVSRLFKRLQDEGQFSVSGRDITKIAVSEKLQTA